VGMDHPLICVGNLTFFKFWFFDLMTISFSISLICFLISIIAGWSVGRFRPAATGGSDSLSLAWSSQKWRQWRGLPPLGRSITLTWSPEKPSSTGGGHLPLRSDLAGLSAKAKLIDKTASVTFGLSWEWR